MRNLNISDAELASLEESLLPTGSQFAEDAKEVIRCWTSTEIAACPGSGKTTVLLAKLKILADRMPLDNNRGICVLSHTNVAVNEIKSRLSSDANRLLGYPNFVGTIQAFIDQYLAMPYIRTLTEEPIRVVDDTTYARALDSVVNYYGPYKTLAGTVSRQIKPNGGRIDCLASLRLNNNELYSNKHRICGENASSTQQFKMAKEQILRENGMITYRDAYQYASLMMDNYPEIVKLICSRFKYIFVDEYQDCDKTQRDILTKLFDESESVVFKIGDPDQAIYDLQDAATEDWRPSQNCLAISQSARYGQEIADILSRLKKEKSQPIISSKGKIGIPPTIILFKRENIEKVLPAFLHLLDRYELFDPNGVYKAIGWRKNAKETTLKIGDYCPDFLSISKGEEDNTYWSLLSKICQSLKDGKLYQTEKLMRKLIVECMHHLKIRTNDGKNYSAMTVKEMLENEYRVKFRDGIMQLAQIDGSNPQAVDSCIRNVINTILIDWKEDPVKHLPSIFMEDRQTNGSKNGNDNVFIEPIRGRKIEFCTVHKAKGETHDATLYLETEKNRSTDIKRIIPLLKGNALPDREIYDYSRKCVYVGFSRPEKLLCVAVEEKTFNLVKDNLKGWYIHDCRE